MGSELDGFLLGFPGHTKEKNEVQGGFISSLPYIH